MHFIEIPALLGRILYFRLHHKIAAKYLAKSTLNGHNRTIDVLFVLDENDFKSTFHNTFRKIL